MNKSVTPNYFGDRIKEEREGEKFPKERPCLRKEFFIVSKEDFLNRLSAFGLLAHPTA